VPLDVVCLCRARPLGTRQNKPFAVCRPFRTRQNKRNRSHLPPHQSKALKWSSPIGLNVLRRIIPLSLSLDGGAGPRQQAGGRPAPGTRADSARTRVMDPRRAAASVRQWGASGSGTARRGGGAAGRGGRAQSGGARWQRARGRVRGAAGRAAEPRGATVSARPWSRVRRRRARGGGTRRPPAPPVG